MPSRVSFQPLARGVYLASFTLDGGRYYYAVNELGDHVEGRSVPIGADPTDAIDALWEILDRRCPASLSTDVPSIPSSRVHGLVS